MEPIEMVSLDEMVPEDHLVRKLEKAIDFSFIYDLVEDLYSDRGRPSIDPVVLIKLPFLQYTFGIRSMRRTIEEVNTNLAYRWFLGFGFYDKVPHFSTFGKNYERRFKDTDLFEQIFYRILKQVADRGLLRAEHVFIDSTHVKASANKLKFTKKVVRKETRAYQSLLEEEINADREENGKKPFPPDKWDREEEKEIKESTTDPESGYYVKDEREKKFAYSCHAATDRNGFFLASIVTPGNVHDSHIFEPLLNAVKEKVGKPLAVAADAGYKTPHIAKVMIDDGIRPCLPYTRPRGKKGYLRKSEFHYDSEKNAYICPNGQELRYSTTNKQGYREYKSNGAKCAGCPLLAQCTQSQNHVKVITRHVWQYYLDQAEAIRLTPENKEIYARRKETVERGFGDAKEKCGMRWTTLRGRAKMSMQAMLTFAALNLKRLACWTWESPEPA
ncbi:IS1182 family transposase [Bhargavaea ginsengi]|uniref:IS1182 family transposase n=1 Tax=Bhargavaea ginsengi TaxID=426757 RepID=UPI003C7355AE